MILVLVVRTPAGAVMVLVARWLMLVMNDDGYGIWLGMLGMMCRRRRRRHGESEILTTPL
jgi:hypothetical protein